MASRLDRDSAHSDSVTSATVDPASYNENHAQEAGPTKEEERPKDLDDKDKFLVNLDENEFATALPTAQKWWCLFVISSSALCVTCASSMVR